MTREWQRELCDFISTHSAEMNHVNVATSFQNTSSFRRDGRSGEIVQHVLDTLLAVQLALHTLDVQLALHTLAAHP